MYYFLRIHRFILLSFFIFITPFTLVAEELVFTPDSDSLKVGLVLSGGGAKGIAHIGIIKALEEAGVRIDYITGTSMGSLVGGLYAIGYSSDQLEEIALSNNWQDLFSEKADRKYISNYEKIQDSRTNISFPITERGLNLPLGVITGQNIYTFLSRLTWHVHGTEKFSYFPIPFASVATVLETGEPKVFKSGYLPDAIQASISVPSAIAPHRIADTLYIDGGISRNLPVQDVIDMGANYVIAVDISNPLVPQDSLNSFAEIMNQTVGFRINDRNFEQGKLADLLIRPGQIEGFTMADFNKTEELLKIGDEIGQKHIEEFRQVAAQQTTPPPPRPGIGEIGSLPMNRVIIEGNTLLDDEFILRELDFTPGTRLSPDIIEDRVTKLFSSRFYETVTYRVIPDTSYFYNLQINIKENENDIFKVGLRYETKTKASILLEANFRNLLHKGSNTHFEARLGSKMEFAADHIYYGALGSSLALLTTVQFQAEEVEWFELKRRVSSFSNEVLRSELSAGNYFSQQNLFTIGLRKDFQWHRNRINVAGIEPVSENYHALFARYRFDSLNRKSYTTEGQRIVAEGFYSDSKFFSPLNFTTASLHWNGFYELSGTITLKNSLYAGYSTGSELPWDYWYSPNRYESQRGFIRYGGFERYEISNRNIQIASLGLQLEPFYHRFISLDFFAGRTLDDWTFDIQPGDINFSTSLSVGALTILGPLQAILSTSKQNPFLFEIQIGYQF
ncbi:MAG: patatin-like phospholipase family protein [Balneolaceae bacterium]